MATIQQTQNFPPMPDDSTGIMTGGALPIPPVPPPGRNPYARRSAAIPVPPMPVMPPEGVAPVTDPASTGTAADASPTTMVLQYLKARGYTPSSENVRRALEANARDPGVIPGLRSDRPATDAEDQAAMAAAGRGRGSAAPGLVREEGTWDTGGSKTSSAPPAAQPTLPTPAMFPRIFDQLSDVSPGISLGRPQLSLPPPEGPSGGGGGGSGGPPRLPPPDPLTQALDTAVPRLPPPPAAPQTQPGVPVPEPPPVPQLTAPPPIPPPAVVPPNPRVTVQDVTPQPSTVGSRALENFRAGGGVRGAIGGGGARGGVGRNFIPGLGGAIMLGTGAKDIYDEWMRQHRGQTPPAS